VGDALTVILAGIPGLLTGLGGLWLIIKTQRRSDKQLTAEVGWEEREKEIEIRKMEEENAVGFLKAIVVERQRVHEADVKRLETQMGKVVRELAHCRKGHRKAEIRFYRIFEILKSKGKLSESEEHEIMEIGKEDSDVIDESAA
jgi:protein tyrosine phosphatase (PTP) superfamily phosphohydrolase (DUF442 family)